MEAQDLLCNLADGRGVMIGMYPLAFPVREQPEKHILLISPPGFGNARPIAL